MAKPVIAYFVHDLNDAAIARRVALLASAGAELRVAGFHRRAAPERVGAAAAVPLGRTRDLRLAQRAAQVARNLLWRGRAARVAQGADIVVARTLEMLAVARGVVGPRQRLVYECLDIHRLMLRRDAIGRAMRAIERALLARTNLVVVSSPRFRDDYFHGLQRHRGPTLLVENKVPADAPPAAPATLPPGPPWRIGWFGMLRCRKSLDLLSAMAAEAAGRIEVLIAGRPNTTLIPDFDARVAHAAHVRFVGAYAPDRLPALYADVHFAWTVDFFEEGLNSRWLLPNRLYEGLANGAVPLADAHVEIGAWLAAHGVGRGFDDLAREVPAFLAALAPEAFAAMRAAVRALPPAAVRQGEAEGVALVAALAGAALPATALPEPAA